ncbi:MAG: carboxypeptidase regulatory-like domain-containing protein [Candidatus Bathyarchaeia archaeon]
MKRNLAAGLLKAVCVLMLVCLPVVSVVSGQEYHIDSMELTVYRDGLVQVAQAMTVNETYPVITVSLLASAVENVLVVDENNLVLDYEIRGSNMTVYSLGARRVVIEYDTVTLTRKEAGVWTLALSTPYNLTVLLPRESTIMYLNQVPTAISTLDNRTVLRLFPGQWEISYALPIIPPPPPGTATVTGTVKDAKTGLPVAGATVGCNGYQTSTGPDGTYSLSVKVGAYLVTVRMEGYETKTASVDASEEKRYTVDFSITPITSSSPLPKPPIPLEYLVPIILFAVGGGFFLLRRRGPPSAERIFKKHPELRKEDREVIRFIAERGGGVLEAEIREEFPELPRTTVWRLLKRLEKMEIVTVEKIGLQNQIELKK